MTFEELLAKMKDQEMKLKDEIEIKVLKKGEKDDEDI